MELSKEQLKAVESDSQYIAILAGAGSGKTRTLTERICYLIEHKGVKAEEILALTFTSKAAGEMKRRVIQNIGDQAKGIWIKTFHSFGLQLLRIFPEYSGLPQNFEIADIGVKNYIVKALGNKFNTALESNNFLPKVSYIKNGIDECESDFQELFNEYNSMLRINNCIDLDDMIWITSKMVQEHQEVQNYLHSKFKHILIDEYQDTNEEQEKLIEMALGENTSLCIVGDDDQCIYEWRGSKPNLIKNFANRDDVETIYLGDNYRSQKYIVELANRFIKNNIFRIIKKMFSKVPTGAKPQFYKTDSEENEASIICSIIKQVCNEDGYKYKDIAILIRSVKQAQPICSALRGNFIPYSRKKDDSSSGYLDIVKVLNAIINYKKNNNLSQGLNFPNSVLDNFTYLDLIDDYELTGETVVDNFETICNDENISWDNRVYFCERYNKLLELNTLFRDNKNTPASTFLKCLHKFYKNQLEQMGLISDAKFKLFTAMLEINREWGKTAESCDLVSFVDYLMCAIENEEEIISYDEEDCVSVMTCHKAKGLEFPVVIIPGVQVGVFPNDYFVHSKEDLEQERRLFYVAITRAVDKLYITSYKNPLSNNGNSLIGAGFVAEIPELMQWRNERNNK